MPRRIVLLAVIGLLTATGPALAQARLISVAAGALPANHDSYNVKVSGDGLRIVFTSKASNLLGAGVDTNGVEDIYLLDARAFPAQMHRISVGPAGEQANGPSDNASISWDGRIVAFNSTATNLGAPPTGGWSNIYVRHIGGTDTAKWTTTWVSRTHDGKVPDSHCGSPSVAGDGLLVAFHCAAGNLVPGDTNGSVDVFVALPYGTQVRRVSTTSAGAEAKNGYSQYPSLSYYGDRVAFESYSNTLVPNDGNKAPDVFVKDLATGVVRRLTGVADAEPNGPSLRPLISGDGRYVVFESQARNMVIGKTSGAVYDVIRWDLNAPPTALVRAERVSVNPDGTENPNGGIRASVNTDGRRVVFESGGQVYLCSFLPAPNFFGEEQLQPHVRMLSLGETGEAAGKGSSFQAAINPNVITQHAIVAWTSQATDLTSGDSNNRWDIYAREVAREPFWWGPRTVRASGGTTVSAEGPELGERWVEHLLGFEPYEEPLRAAGALAPLPAVTIGGVPATAVATPDANTLRFSVPPAAAGTSKMAVIRYADGEVLTLPLPLRAMTLVPGSTTDTDQDSLPDWWELTWGLDASVANAASSDSDGDDLTDAQEYAQGHHPRGTQARYLAEGATGSMFLTRVALMNPGVLPATALLRYLKRDGTLVTQTVPVGPHSRATVDVETVGGMADAEFSTAIEADEALVVDRTMRWTPAGRYGSHAERSIPAPAITWYLAEGATHSGFDLFYLLQNPNTTDADVRVRYLLPGGAPLEKRYTVPASSRFNVWVDNEQFPEGSGNALLANTDVSAVIEVQNGVPIIVERAMYLTRGGQFFAAGHESAGVTAPATRWSLAEGATGPYFDLFVLIANPNAEKAEVTATYLLEGGTTVTKGYTVGANSRFNIWVDYEDARLADAAVSTTIEVTNGVPVIVERAMWWPGGYATWAEAHNSAGSTETAARWGLAEGEVGGADASETYILIANTSPFSGQAVVTLLFEDGTTDARPLDLAPSSRTNVPVRDVFGAAVTNRRFGAIVESLPVSPNPAAQIAVERAMYGSPGGVFWAAGSNALATKLP